METNTFCSHCSSPKIAENLVLLEERNVGIEIERKDNDLCLASSMRKLRER